MQLFELSLVGISPGHISTLPLLISFVIESVSLNRWRGRHWLTWWDYIVKRISQRCNVVFRDKKLVSFKKSMAEGVAGKDAALQEKLNEIEG